MCAALVQGPARTKVVVLMARREQGKTTNTGRLAPLLLEGSEVRIHGAEGAPLAVADLLADPARRACILDPWGPRTVEAFAADDPRPVTLLVPDGTWRQARRIAGAGVLHGVPRVRLPAGAPSGYRLRDGGKADRLATLEAIARALGLLEGPALQARLEAAFSAFVDATLASRGSPEP